MPTDPLQIGPQRCVHCAGQACPQCHQTGFGPQYFAYSSTADIIGFGGAAGGGKSFFAYTKPWIRGWTDEPTWQGVYFRCSLPDLRRSVWRHARVFGQRVGAGVRNQPLQLTAPSGAALDFFGIERLGDIEEKFDGAELPYVVFDEAQHYEEACPRFFFTRQRSIAGCRSQLVLTFNPGGRGHSWLFRWFAPWLDPAFKSPAKRYEKRYFFDSWDDRGEPVFQWTTPDGQLVRPDSPPPTPGQLPRSITFIGARLEDNPALTEADPTYENRMRGTDRVTYEQKRHGNFLIRHTIGTTFSRDMFRIVTGRVPESLVRRRIRFWDRAGTEGAGDHTSGVLMALLNDPATGAPLYVIEDVISLQWSVDKVVDLMFAIAGAAEARTRLEQKLRAAGQWNSPKSVLTLVNTPTGWALPKDPPGTILAQEVPPSDAGLEQVANFLKEARRLGLQARALHTSERGSKKGDGVNIAHRMQPLAVDAQNGRVQLLAGPWNARFLDRMQSFDGKDNGGLPDDDPDAATGAHQLLADWQRHNRFTIGRDR